MSFREMSVAAHLKSGWATVVQSARSVATFFKVSVFGWFGGTLGSRQRRLAIRLSLFWSLIYILSALLSGEEAVGEASPALSVASAALIIASFVIFVVVALLMPFRDRAEFRIDAKRLMMDTIVSALFSIVAFSLFYRNVGLVHQNLHVFPDATTALYFSSVTFSTLGYGDFAPSEGWRIVASTQALIGNLHLGMIVGSTFAAIRG